MSEQSTTQHTPTPWRVGGHPGDSSGTQWREILTDATEFAPSHVGQALDTDAQFIVRAVNSHDAMAEALEALEPYLATKTEMLDYASLNEGRASSFDVASLKAREALASVRAAR